MNAQLREAAEWRLIGLLLECPRAGWPDQVRRLASEVSDPALREAAQAAAGEAAEGLYHSIFGPGGPAPPREVSYRDSVQLGYLMAELASYYDAFAYQPDTPEVPDHVAVEAGFIGYLRLKEAYAVASGDPERAEITSEAARRFIDEHLSVMAEPLAAALENSGVRYLALAAQALLRRTGPPRTLPVLSSDTESLFTCGATE